MPGTHLRSPSVRIELHPRYGLLTFAYLGGIYWLSSLPGLGLSGSYPGVQLAANLFHIPLYAGLTFCFLQAISGGQGRQEVSWAMSGLTLLGTGAWAALDEWHQAFVPGRSASVGDFFVDLVGIVGMLLLLRRVGADSVRPSQQPRATKGLTPILSPPKR